MQRTGIDLLARRRWLGLWAVLLATAAVVFLETPAPVRAADPVDVQLVLAIDTSGSVSPRRFTLQQQGYVDAFRDPRVLAAIQSGMTRTIAVTMFQWTGPQLHVPVVPWTRVSDQASAEALASAINAVPRKLFGGGTSISGAIDFAMGLFPQSPYAGERRIIDVSGDGSNNSGRPAEAARDEAVKTGVTINGLPILTVEPGLDDYYQNSVVGGEGSFVITVKTDGDFAAAILKKLIAEIAMKGS